MLLCDDKTGNMISALKDSNRPIGANDIQRDLIKGYLGRYTGQNKRVLQNNSGHDESGFGDVVFRCLYKDGKIGNVSFIIGKEHLRSAKADSNTLTEKSYKKCFQCSMRCQRLMCKL